VSRAIICRHRDVWERKPLLRAIYNDWYREMFRWFLSGKTLEVGGGSGNLKQLVPEIVSTDVVELPWLDAVSNAQYLSFRSESFSNIVIFDVLHHLENPILFISEALRVLKPGGRFVIMEPYVSWASYPVYRFLHPEPLDLSADPFRVVPHDPNREPFHSNQGIPTLLLERYWNRFRESFPAFRKLSQQWLGFLVYPLSGGFDHPPLIPTWLYRPLHWTEKCFSPFGRFIAFRFLVVLEKTKSV